MKKKFLMLFAGFTLINSLSLAKIIACDTSIAQSCCQQVSESKKANAASGIHSIQEPFSFTNFLLLY